MTVGQKLPSRKMDPDKKFSYCQKQVSFFLNVEHCKEIEEVAKIDNLMKKKLNNPSLNRFTLLFHFCYFYVTSFVKPSESKIAALFNVANECSNQVL